MSTQLNLPSVCPLDCPDTCSLEVEVTDGVVTKVMGSKANPFTDGKICNKVARGLPGLVHGPTRLTHPLRRTGSKGSGSFERISWEAALDTVHDGFQQIIQRQGPESIVPFNYSGPAGFLNEGAMSQRFFHRLGASLVRRSPLCAGASYEAYESLFGPTPGVPPQELADARLIVIWGNNVTVSALHLTTWIRRARKQGAKLVVIDPKRIRIAEVADLHLGLLPGSDVALGYAIAAELERMGALDRAFLDDHAVGVDAYLERAREFSLERAAEICGLAVEDLRTFAELWRDTRPACTVVGVGPERNRNGGGGIRTALALPVLTGNFGVPGAGIMGAAGEFFPTLDDALERPDLVPEGTRELSILDIPDHILDPDFAPPIEGLFVFNHNPVAVHPRQHHVRAALSREDLFIVGCDVAMTDSMAYADVILPAATHLEYADVYAAYGQAFLQRAEPVISPVGESLPNLEIFRRLALRFGFEDEAFAATDAELAELAVDWSDPRIRLGSAADLAVDDAIDLAPAGAPTLLRGLSPRTPSGKAELYSKPLEESRGEGLPSFRPLTRSNEFVLVSPASDRRTNSTFGGVAALDEETSVEMNPEDAARHALEGGQRVRLSNDGGEVLLRLRITSAVRRGTLFVAKGSWLRTSETGQTINALIPDHRADLGDGACYYDAQVDIHPA
ncbi:MAG: molybdopterin-dependent oxidoreductase [Myxococcota bacterium]